MAAHWQEEGKAGRDTPAGKGEIHACCLQGEGRTLRREGTSVFTADTAVLDPDLLKDDNEINLACSHFPSQ